MRQGIPIKVMSIHTRSRARRFYLLRPLQTKGNGDLGQSCRRATVSGILGPFSSCWNCGRRGAEAEGCNIPRKENWRVGLVLDRLGMLIPFEAVKTSQLYYCINLIMILPERIPQCSRAPLSSW